MAETMDVDSSELLTRYGREIDRLKKQISEVLAENEELHKDRQRLIEAGRTKEDWEELQELTNTLVQENKLLIGKDEANQTEIQRMEKKMQKQREEIQQLQEEKGQQDIHAQRVALELSRLRDENSRLQRENARIRADAQVRGGTGYAPPSDQYQHSDTESAGVASRDGDHHDRIIQDLTNEHVREVSRLRDTIQQLQGAVNQKERHIVQMQSKVQEATALVTALRDRLDAVHQEKRRLSERLAQVELNYEAALQERAQYLAHLDSAIKIAEHRKHELASLMAASEVSKAERDRALMEAARRDAQLDAISRQLEAEQQQARQQLLDAVDMVRLQRSNYKRMTGKP
ncbi:hypothetical protein PTSG_01346 [Salpingoeca rosetta]|uniref:Ubiquitin-like domain-containing protein n=1 Tax=Salpingoeca rosetta (strain ATCC 50818 / BSB-021) TaxID=946362 RepID=F2U029_SALR5|nr:uncharacterized protein PTSG_01346 [Salpingoeca rosetta]EGD80757.1 hypothetical protein PTSG_01346 [Salpingoeca rosetta]|eukprot:XP_004997318.1 hypothetical protein PTSG_01346 [Salpingoeca rosetta]